MAVPSSDNVSFLPPIFESVLARKTDVKYLRFRQHTEVAKTIGATPRMNAKEVRSIGRRRAGWMLASLHFASTIAGSLIPKGTWEKLRKK